MARRVKRYVLPLEAYNEMREKVLAQVRAHPPETPCTFRALYAALPEHSPAQRTWTQAQFMRRVVARMRTDCSLYAVFPTDYVGLRCGRPRRGLNRMRDGYQYHMYDAPAAHAHRTHVQTLMAHPDSVQVMRNDFALPGSRAGLKEHPTLVAYTARMHLRLAETAEAAKLTGSDNLRQAI